jgi:prepilin-type N-terminal cleavage/methylation domain-containing protein
MSGFTLVEISVALLALGIVLLGATVFWQQSASVRVADVQQDIQDQARQSLVGFLYTHHRLPCPATDANGSESCASAGGLRQVGYVPWMTLGLPRPEAGRLRYGVYREASATASTDRDLASARDRMNPLRVATPNPRPANGRAPNGSAPPIPLASEGLLGATQSGNAASPLNAACNPSSSPPCPIGGAASVNLIDVCLALNTASGVGVAPTGQLGVRMAATRRAVAFVVAAPGLLDADGDGQGFDGANASASDANPTFESSSLSVTNLYDDQVLAVSHAELFSKLHCATGLAAISHTHFNTATGAFVLERGLYDYRDQLYVDIMLARAKEAAASAGEAAALVVVAAAVQAGFSAAADTTMSLGARAPQIALAVVAGVTAVVAEVAAALAIEAAVSSRELAEDTHNDFAARTTASTDLSISINQNALVADAIGF